MQWIRDRLESGPGKAVGVAVSLLLLIVAGFMVTAYIRGDTAAVARESVFICTETGKAFAHTNKNGEVSPIYSPFSGKPTGIRAEACYWTASGAPKSSATWVLLNEFIKKPGPTFCPDCGRRVLGHNPVPGSGVRPPPTKKEYDAGARSKTAHAANEMDRR